jgi:hypothetical protein
MMRLTGALIGSWIVPYLPVLTPLLLIFLKIVYLLVTGWEYRIKHVSALGADYPSLLLLPVDFFLAGLVFDCTMLALFFRLQRLQRSQSPHVRAVAVSGGTALTCFFMSVFGHPVGALIALSYASQNAAVLTMNQTSFTPSYYWFLVISAALSFALPATLARN